MKKEQIEALGKITSGKWEIEFKQKWPFGLSVNCGDKNIIQQDAYCCSSVQNTREDNEMARGFKASERQMAMDAIAEQDSNGIAIAALPDLIAERQEMIEALKEMREVCAAAFRIISTAERATDAFTAELKRLGIKEGFGIRAQELLRKAEGDNP